MNWDKVVNEDRISQMSMEELKIVADILDIYNKKKPNWMGIKGIKFIWHNEWADPELQYKGKLVSCTLVQDTMWERFYEETGSEDDEDFVRYIQTHVDDVKELIEHLIKEKQV